MEDKLKQPTQIKTPESASYIPKDNTVDSNKVSTPKESTVKKTRVSTPKTEQKIDGKELYNYVNGLLEEVVLDLGSDGKSVKCILSMVGKNVFCINMTQKNYFGIEVKKEFNIYMDQDFDKSFIKQRLCSNLVR